MRRLRTARGLTQRELASPGVSYAYISRLEAGARRPSIRALRQLAAKLGVSPEYLETGTLSPLEEGVVVEPAVGVVVAVGDLRDLGAQAPLGIVHPVVRRAHHRGEAVLGDELYDRIMKVFKTRVDAGKQFKPAA